MSKFTDEQIAKIIGEPYDYSLEGLKLTKKIQNSKDKECNIIFEALNSDLRYENGSLILIKE